MLVSEAVWARPWLALRSRVSRRSSIFLHILGVVFILATSMAVVGMMPAIARKEFGTNHWQTLLITTTPVAFFTVSIFWSDLFTHRRFSTYMLIFWAVGCLPLALISAATGYTMLLIPHMLCAIGGAGYYPAAGELLKRLYPAKSRGRIFGVVSGMMYLGNAAMGYGMGVWLSHDNQGYRYFLPLAAALQLVGVGIFIYLASRVDADTGRVRTQETSTLLERVLRPIAQLSAVLRADPVFARYEAAYMTYGIGWMICYALLPFIVTEKLKLNYEQIATSTHVAYLVGLVLMMWPSGYFIDRIGAIKSVGISFAMLAFYPVGLIFSDTLTQLTIVSFLYGVSHAVTSVGWTLGPVALAPEPSKVSQYVAIHATLVGLRGIVFQGVGVGIYYLTNSFTLPLIFAAIAFGVSAVQMWSLHRRVLLSASPVF